MKKYFSFLIFVVLSIFLVSCGEPSSEVNDKLSEKYVVKMAKTDLEKHLYNNEEYESFLMNVQEFSHLFSEAVYESYKEDENFTVSPISVYMALAMTVEATNGSTREEILNALGMSYEEVATFTKNLFSDCNSIYTGQGKLGNKVIQGFEDLRNSIWVDEDIKFNDNALNSLADKFYTTAYQVPFQRKPKEAAKALQSYIKKQTRGLIDKEYEFSDETIFAIVNTYYLKEIWNEFGNELKFTKNDVRFTNYDNSIDMIKLLTGYYFNGKPYVTEKYSYAATKTNHGFKLKFIIPNDGYTVDDIFNKEVLKEVNDLNNYLATDDERREYNHTRCFFPEFEAEYDGDIKGILKNKMGIESLFNVEYADFSNLIDGRAYIEEVIHQTKLTVNRRGIEGAAVTVELGAGAAGPGPYVDVYHDFYVNKAFAFIISDSNDTVLFSGVVKNV